jgi:hypothetical protein
MIAVKNYGPQDVIGTITLYRNDEAVETWSTVKFEASESVTRFYRDRNKGDDNRTIGWYARVDVPNDPNLSNNTSDIMTTTVRKCKEDHHD